LDEILLEGIVVNDDDQWIYKYFGVTAFSPSTIRAALKKANGGPVNVRINSPGGEVTSASVIYSDLRGYKGEVSGQITGMAASAASVIAMACKTLQMSPTAEMMIHNSTLATQGDHREMDHASDVLRSTDDAIANAYAGKTKLLTKAQIKNMMAKETWLNANEAIADGLVDAMMFEDGASAPGPANGSNTEPAEPLPGARAAAHNIPSAAALKERKRVWDELAPGAASLDEAKARLAAATAPPGPTEPETPPAEPLEPEPSAPDDSAEIALLRAQIDVLAQF
jgi:ATP-dependent protease ClpP protease subunit